MKEDIEAAERSFKKVSLRAFYVSGCDITLIPCCLKLIWGEIEGDQAQAAAV